jgi:hypothetical protein
MSSVSRRIARDGVSKGVISRKREMTAEGLAIALGIDTYHARIALRGTTISPVGHPARLRAWQKQAEAEAELLRLVAA